MAVDKTVESDQVEWQDFLTRFHDDIENAKGRIRKVDLFPESNLVCFVLYDVFSPIECQFFIDSLENIGFNELPHANAYRTNTRTQVTQKSLAEAFFIRVYDFLPKQWSGSGNTSHWELLNLNEQLRFCRYEPGQHFSPHCDGIFKRSYMEQSQLTIMAYLNNTFSGGNTNFLEDFPPHRITYALKPEPGMILIFQHDMFHEGERIQTGRKYILRSDVIYKRTLIAPMSTEEEQARVWLTEAESFEEKLDYDQATKYYRKAYKMWPQLEKEFGK